MRKSRISDEQIIAILREQEAGRPALEDENRRLKKLLAEQMMDVATLKEMLTKNF